MRITVFVIATSAVIFGVAFLTTLLWYCFDDHLAVAFGAPGLGLLPWWVPFLGRVFISSTSSSSKD